MKKKFKKHQCKSTAAAKQTSHRRGHVIGTGIVCNVFISIHTHTHIFEQYCVGKLLAGITRGDVEKQEGAGERTAGTGRGRAGRGAGEAGREGSRLRAQPCQAVPGAGPARHGGSTEDPCPVEGQPPPEGWGSAGTPPPPGLWGRNCAAAAAPRASA